ncbi:MAG: UDP-N-acetylmuramate dehydrogenase [Cardiobacteriaceae bacterium]|nr:UDP-N-acetylmuramate dehydrogenase [Cardiobacteriaceae bacterium]
MQSLRHVDLRDYHTLAAPLFADSLTLIDTETELAALPRHAIILGRGSNVIFADDIQIPLVKLATHGWHIVTERSDSVSVRVKGGHEWHDFVVASVEAGWQGLENLALIPGTVGAAPVQNIGAYGVEVGQFIEQVGAYDRLTSRQVQIPGEKCGFAYRNSYFKRQWRERFIITDVTFRLNKIPKLCLDYAGLREKRDTLTDARAVMHEIIHIRESKLPDPAREPNAGSFFHNPVIDREKFALLRERYPDMPAHTVGGGMKIPAAWLIEQAGMKGFRQGKVGMSAQHALVLTNQGGSGRDILQFAALVQAAVWQRFVIDLHIEPIVIGE